MKKISFEPLRMNDQLMQFHSQDCDAPAPSARSRAKSSSDLHNFIVKNEDGRAARRSDGGGVGIGYDVAILPLGLQSHLHRATTVVFLNCLLLLLLPR